MRSLTSFVLCVSALALVVVGCSSAGSDGDGAPPQAGGASGTTGGMVAQSGGGASAAGSGGSAAGAPQATPIGGNGAGSGGKSTAGSGGMGTAGSGGGGRSGGAAGSGAAGGVETGGAAGTGGGSSVVFPPNCTCLNLGPPSCTPTGNVTFKLEQSASPTADEQSAYERITCAMTAATAYYNCNTTVTKQLGISYTPSVKTADGNSNGSIRFGSDRSYMVCATAMHEIGHALGVGTAPNWSKLSVGGVFTGATAIAKLRAITGKADDVLHSDTQHFWPYGLNYASEAKSTDDLVDHCLMVSAIRTDLGL